jgi:hypothetical protein
VVVGALPILAAQIVVFDLLICNFDRHRGNLAYRPTSRRLDLFDHSHALLGIQNDAGAHLRVVQDQFILNGIVGAGGRVNRHCLIDHLSSADQLLSAADYVLQRFSDCTLTDICDEAEAMGLITPGEHVALITCLRRRWTNLRQMLYDNHTEFRSIAVADWGLPIP